MPTVRALSILALAALGWLSTPLWSQPLDPSVFGPQLPHGDKPYHEFYLARGIYSDNSYGYYAGNRWAIDYPKADRQFLVALSRLTGIDAYSRDNAISLADPDLRRYPFLYVLEVGTIALTSKEQKGLRDYLLAGGFLVVDDFWGTRAFERFRDSMAAVLPGYEIVDVPRDHPIFHVFYDIDEIVQVPNLRQGQEARYGGPTHEYDGYFPEVKGIFDEYGRLMVLINWNTDLGDAWEWADDPDYPLKFSTYAYEIGINFVVYAMLY